MKPRDFQRSVKARRYDRSAGDAPILGRVARMPRIESKGQRRRRKRGEGSSAGRGRAKATNRVVLWVWSSILAAVTLVLVVSFMVLWLKSKRASSMAMGALAEPVREERVQSRFPSPKEEEALNLVKRAMALTEESAVAECFRIGRSSSAEILEFLNKWRREEGKVTRTDWLSSMDANGLLLEGVLVFTGAYPEEKNRLAFLTPDEEGRWKIDFEAFARAVRPSWSEIMAPSSAGGLVRVIVVKDSYFNGPFRESDGWACFGMASPDVETNFYGYCRVDSAPERAMNRILDSADDPEEPRRVRRATLEIVRVAGAGPRQFEIKRVLAEDWVLSEKAFDGSSG